MSRETSSSPRRPSRGGRRWALMTHGMLIIGGITMVLPLLWMVSTSLKEPTEVMTYPPEFVPRRQVMWSDPAGGDAFPVYELTWQGQQLQVARLSTAAGQMEVQVLAPAGRAGERLTLPLGSEAGQGPVLVPVKEVHLRWQNYPEAWQALTLQRNWLSWHWPYQLRLGPLRIGPLHFPGFPLRNAFLAFYLNSLIITCLVTVGAVFTSSLAAFAFARLHFPGRDRLFLGYLGTMMVPQVVTMIPVFILLKVMGLVDTYAALILPPLFTAYGTFMLRQFFLNIPGELEDAARIDGCNLWQIYRHVIIPLSLPALATLTTFEFLGVWNSFMWPLIVISSQEKKPLMLGLYAFMGQHTTEWTLLMAASVMVLAPVIIVFLLGQRFFVRGIVMTGMK